MKRFKNVQDYAIWLISCREYTVHKLRTKCLEKFPEDSEVIEKLINNFVQKEYLSDQRFAEHFTRAQIRMGQGRQKIFMKLLEKGVPKDLIESALETGMTEEDVLGPAVKLLNKKSVQLKKKYPDLSDYEYQQKLTAYLAGRGYSYEVIKEVLSGEEEIDEK